MEKQVGAMGFKKKEVEICPKGKNAKRMLSAGGSGHVGAALNNSDTILKERDLGTSVWERHFGGGFYFRRKCLCFSSDRK